jgi:hypothetical protein
MIRSKGQSKGKIAWRNHEVLRIEAFSDAVFAFAISLLVISLEVPKNSRELFELMHGLIPFAICCVIVFWVWRAQYKFFRRYGLHDDATLFLNAILLFVILGFVYPLKFLFSLVFLNNYTVIDYRDYFLLVELYNGGFAIIDLLFVLMYLIAAGKKDVLKLTPVEYFETINHAGYFAIPMVASITAMYIAYIFRDQGEKINFCYVGYVVVPIFMTMFGYFRHRSFKRKYGNVVEQEPHYGTEG